MNAESIEQGAPEAVRRRLALALDTDDLVEAHRVASLLRPWFGVAKVGLELFSAAGPDAVGSLRERERANGSEIGVIGWRRRNHNF